MNIRKLCSTFNDGTKWADRLILIMTVFTCTFFIYRDFGLRMIYGYAVMGLLLLVYFLRLLLNKKAIKFEPLKLSFAFLCVVIFINFLRPDSNHDDNNVSYAIAMLICTCFTAFCEPQKNEGKIVLKVLTAAAIFMSAYVIFFVIFPDVFWNTIYNWLTPLARDYLTYYVPKGYSITINGCTYTDYVMAIGMACCCGNLAVIPKSEKKRKIALILLCLVFFGAIFLVGRRGELVGIAATFTVLFVFRGTLKKRLIRAGILIGAAALAFGAFYLLLPTLKNVDILHRYVVTFENLLASKDITSGRLELYDWAWNMFLKNPIFGGGWGNFVNCITPEFHAIHGADVKDVHCIYLQFLCETGIIGAVLVITPLVYSYVETLKQFFRFQKLDRTTVDSQAVAFNYTSFCIQTFLLGVGIYDPNFERLIFWCFYALAIMLEISALRIEGHRSEDFISKPLYFIGDKITALIETVFKKIGKVKE